jgi:hypothetical protein
MPRVPNSRLAHIERKLDRILVHLMIGRKIDMATWQKVRDEIARQKTVSASVIVFINDLKARLADLASKPNGPSAEEMQTVVNELDQTTDEMAAAVVVNTPAEQSDPLITPAGVSGQPSTTFPDGVAREPFPSDHFPKPEDVDMSPPKPQGSEPVRPEE